MVSIDIKTLFFLSIAGYVFIIFFLSVYILSQKVRAPFIKVFILAKLLLLSQLFIYVSNNGELPNPNLAILAFLFFIFGVAYETYCIALANQKFERTQFFRFNSIPFALSLIFVLISIVSESHVRVFLTNLIGTLMYLSGGLYLIFGKPKTKIQGITSFFFLVIAILFLSRLLWTAFADTDSGLYTSNIINLVSYITIFLVSFTSAIILLLILKERDEEAIEKSNIQLQKLITDKDKFFSIISHDLRGPLGNLFKLGELLWIQQDTVTQPQRKKILQGIYQSSKQTFLLLDNLLKWANSNSGVIKYEPHQINLKDIIDENLNIFKSKADSKKIDLKSFITQDLLVYADNNMINTVVRNLISNAMKFTSNSGQIKILTKKMEEGESHHSIGVIDNGIGMSESILSKVLEMDSNISTSGTENESGSGLGLKLCKEFVLRNKGRIWIESEELRGTKIWFTLPVRCA